MGGLLSPLSELLPDLLEGVLLLELLDLFENLEDLLGIAAMAGFRSGRGPDEPEHGVVVDGLAGEPAVLHHLPDLVELSGRLTHHLGLLHELKTSTAAEA